MVWKVFSPVFTLVVVSMLIFYLFFPFNTVEFHTNPNSSDNFSLNTPLTRGMQFYKNMRYPNSKISYKIENCPLYKQNKIKWAFKILSNLTVLNFYPVSSDEEISATCKNRNRIENGLFVAGEGGPINITKTKDFNVILHGEILLIKESKCKKPDIVIHEILHALGFKHSLNPNNIMYKITKCGQILSKDIINRVNELYSVPDYPDLAFENVSAIMYGKHLDTNVSIRNNGLKDSKSAELLIYADGKFIKKIKLNPIKVGYGLTISLKNILVLKINVNELEFSINSSFNELNKKNNKIKLEIKNN